MNLNRLLVDRNISKYKLSKLTNIPYSTLNDIFNDKTDIMNCSVMTLYKISKVLGVSIETLISEENDFDLSDRTDFETFKSNVKHLVKENPTHFINYVHDNHFIIQYINKKYYPEALYLLAMIDYLSRINGIPTLDTYKIIRRQKLNDRLYPASVIVISQIDKDSNILETSYMNSIEEFKQFNIVESEIDNIA
jgi:plasmid maintenance system antidote protein VapI